MLGGAPAPVKRAREEFVVHFPHYDKDEQGPASAIIVGNYKLIRTYETGVPLPFDLSKDAGEQHDLAKENAKVTAELDRRLSEYLKAVSAQMPTPNAAFDPAKAKAFEERRGARKNEPGAAQ